VHYIQKKTLWGPEEAKSFITAQEPQTRYWKKPSPARVVTEGGPDSVFVQARMVGKMPALNFKNSPFAHVLYQKQTWNEDYWFLWVTRSGQVQFSSSILIASSNPSKNGLFFASVIVRYWSGDGTLERKPGLVAIKYVSLLGSFRSVRVRRLRVAVGWV